MTTKLIRVNEATARILTNAGMAVLVEAEQSTYHAVAYSDGKSDVRFTVRADNDAEAITYAKSEAKKLKLSHVFVENKSGKQVFDGAVR